jgi:hypothetical protein
MFLRLCIWWPRTTVCPRSPSARSRSTAKLGQLAPRCAFISSIRQLYGDYVWHSVSFTLEMRFLVSLRVCPVCLTWSWSQTTVREIVSSMVHVLHIENCGGQREVVQAGVRLLLDLSATAVNQVRLSDQVQLSLPSPVLQLCFCYLVSCRLHDRRVWPPTLERWQLSCAARKPPLTWL